MSGYRDYIKEEDEDEDEALENHSESYKQTEVREAIAFLIEITPDLLLHPASPETTLSTSNESSKLFELLSSINELMQDLIKTSKNTGVGLYFYNCQTISPLRKMQNPPGFNRLFSLDPVNLHHMKRLNDVIDDLQRGIISSLHDVFKYQPMEDEIQLTTIMNKMIDEFIAKKMFNKQRLIWITTNDQPYKHNKTKEALWRIIDDYYAYGFYIEPFFIIPLDKREFDFQPFKDLFMNTDFLKKKQTTTMSQLPGSNDAKDVGDEAYANVGDEKFNHENTGFSKNSLVLRKSILGSQIRKSILGIKEVKRVLFTCNLILSDGGTLGGGFGCTVKGYQLYTHEKVRKRDFYVYTREETIMKVFTETKLVKEGGVTPPKVIELKKEPKLSFSEKKDEAGIRKGFFVGDKDILLLDKEQMDFFKNYTFDHRQVEGSQAGKSGGDDDDDDDDEGDDHEDENERGEGKQEQDYALSQAYSKPPYLQLIGFRDLKHFNPSLWCGTAEFVTADVAETTTPNNEVVFTNSLQTFASLYRSCIRLKKYPVVFGCTRKNMRPYLYSMYPTRCARSTKNNKNADDQDDRDDQDIQDDRDGTEFPEGFVLVKMPWLEDVRALPADYIKSVLNSSEKLALKTDSALVSQMTQLIQSNKMSSYAPRDWPNPSLNYFYKVLKHEVLQTEFFPNERTLTKNDITVQKLAELKNRMSESDKLLIKRINARIGELGDCVKKRVLQEDVLVDAINEQERAKKQKLSKKSVVELSEADVLLAWKSNTLNNFTMDQLKMFRKKYPDIMTAVKKQDMVDNIAAYLEENRMKH